MRFVPVEALCPGMMMARDIVNNHKDFMIRKGTKLTAKYIVYLQKKGYLGAYITDDASEDIDIEETIEQETFLAGVKAVEEENVGAIIDVASSIVDQISKKKEISLDLFDLRAYDDYTFHHSVNVAVYAAAIGKKMKFKSWEMEELTQAALCHDLGKARVPAEILKKPGKLTDEEYRVIKQHPQYSYDILFGNPDIPSVVRQAVLFHHENEDGTGYPFGRSGDGIPIYAKIIHAVDVYDALTSKRPYKSPYSSADALQYMEGGRGMLFDDKVVDIMMEVIPAYPPGIDIRLSNGEAALVVEHTSVATRPMVKIVEDKRIVNLKTDPDYKDVTVAESGIMPPDYVGKIESLNEDRMSIKNSRDVIMIVDDSMVSIKQTEAALGDEFTYASFTNPIDALNYFNENKPPKLVIMDINMPTIDGITAVEKIKAKGFNKIPIIFLSGVTDRNVIMRCRAIGGTVDYVLKPANPVYLRTRVDIGLKKLAELEYM